MSKLKDRTYIVTGGASGLGHATAKRLASDGAKIAVMDLRLEAARQVADDINKEFPEAAIAIETDVTDNQAVKDGTDEVIKTFGSLHGVVNCAGIALGEGGVVECEEDSWNKMMDVNVKSIFLTS